MNCDAFAGSGRVGPISWVDPRDEDGVWTVDDPLPPGDAFATLSFGGRWPLPESIERGRAAEPLMSNAEAGRATDVLVVGFTPWRRSVP
jgi:hypothetical protein